VLAIEPGLVVEDNPAAAVVSNTPSMTTQ